jgi:2-C-methyl-D-erythritol 4-phosphate cytidylyltransferase
VTASVWAVVPAAGSGKRMAAEIPKQYLLLDGLPILEQTLRALLACPDIRGVVVVLDPSDRRADSIESLADPRVMTAVGGAERADSVLSGLERLNAWSGPSDWVLVHDAARPCISVATLRELIKTSLGSGVGSILAQVSTDTIKRIDDDGRVVETQDRRELVRAQTPQLFQLGLLQQALAQALSSDISITDESMAMELAGHPVQVVNGPATNMKITLPGDLEFAEIILKRLQGRGIE